MVTPPFVSEVTDGQIVAFFRAMAPLSRTGMLVYNAPGIGITLSPDLLEQLADIPGVVGVKQGDLAPARSTSSPIGSAGGCACSARPIWRSSAR